MRKPKPEPVFADHFLFGSGEILAVRKPDIAWKGMYDKYR